VKIYFVIYLEKIKKQSRTERLIIVTLEPIYICNCHHLGPKNR